MGAASPAGAQEAPRAAGPDAAAGRELLRDVEPPSTTGPAATGAATKPASTPEAREREERLRLVEAQLRELLRSVEDLRQGGAAPAEQPVTRLAAPPASPAATQPSTRPSTAPSQGLLQRLGGRLKPDTQPD